MKAIGLIIAKEKSPFHLFPYLLCYLAFPDLVRSDARN
jgi:hypothetical protein